MKELFTKSLFFLIISCILIGSQSNAQSNYTSNYNFETFTIPQSSNLEHWRKHNKPTYYQHPEFGILPESAPDEPCVEILEKRTANERYFVNINDPSAIYYQKSYGVINEWKDGHWISVRNNLQSTSKGIYENRSQISTVVLHTQHQNTVFKEANGNIFFNNWLLLIKSKGAIVKSISPNWNKISVGENGAYITNIFDGIDAEIIVVKGKVKTNFIIKSNRFGEYDELIFRDRYQSNSDILFEFENTKGHTGIDNVIGYRGNKAVLEIGMAHAYIAHQMESTVTTMPYTLHKNNLDVIVPYTWINENISKGYLIVDPLVTTTASKLSSTITGSKYGATCFTEYCSYNLNVPTPISSVITDVRFTFNYLANSPCAVKDGGFSLHYGTCRSPALAGAHYCNLTGAGICNAIDVSIFGSMNACIDEVYCTPTNLNFEMRFYRCVQNTSGCSGSCIGAASDWIMTIYANSLFRSEPTLSASTICQGSSVSGSIVFNNGAEPYTHAWSMSADGSSPLATGSDVTMTVPGSGLTKIYVLTTDACGLTYLDSVNLMIHPSYHIIEYDTVCAMELPIVWNGITVYGAGSPAATLTNTTSFGCDSNKLLYLTIIPTITATETINICPEMLPYTWNGKTVTSGGYSAARDTTVSSVSGCDSITILNLILTPAINVVETIHICTEALPYNWNGMTISAGGSAVATYPTTSMISGCDSITTLNLMVHPPATYNHTDYFCTGGSYLFGSTTYTSPGAYTHTFESIYGCDSTVNLTLIQSPMDTANNYAWKCRLATYDFYGSTYDSEGTYLYIDTSADCHIVRRLYLVDYDTIRTYNWYSICFGDSIVWDGSAIYESGTFVYTGVNASGCDTIHTLNINVMTPDTIDMYQSICPYDTFDFYDTDVYEAGIYYHTAYSGVCMYTYRLNLELADTLRTYNWIYICSGGSTTYDGTVITEAGTYNFTGVNASGCDTIFTLYVYVNPAHYEYFYETICQSQSFEFFDSNYTETGIYYHSTDSGCDTTRVLYLTVIDTIRTYYYTSMCEGDVYNWAGVNYTLAGTYPLAGTTSAGCDTLHTISITTWTADTINVHDTICPDADFDFYGMDLPSSGIYVHRDTVGQCDTIWRLYLTMMDTILTQYTDTLCTGNSYTWAGVTYTTTGTWNLSGVNSRGCDTIHTIQLTFTPPDTLVTIDTTCSGNNYYFYGSYYNSTGTYFYASSIGYCDIAYQLDLFVRDTIRTTTFDTICSGMYFEFAGDYIFSSGTYYYYGTNMWGCDTLRTINLFVSPPHMDTTFATICPGETYNFFGIAYDEAGTYTRSSIAEGCDTAYILLLHIPTIPNLHDTFEICAGNSIEHDGTFMTTSGVYPFYYTSVDGCDSNYTITLNVVPYIEYPMDTTVCENTIYTFFDTLINLPGVYYHLVDDPDCDTLYILTLNHYPIYRQVQTLTLCNNELPYSHLGMNIPYGSSSTSLFDSVMLVSSKGCDSLIVLDIIIQDTSRTDLDTLVCYNTVFSFGTHTITSPGAYTYVTDNAIGCDSVVVLNVEYTPVPIEVDSMMSACYSVTYNDSIFYESTQFVDTFRDFISCDSLYRFVKINVLREPHDTMYASICQGQVYTFNGKDYSTPIIVTDTFLYHNGCDSTITLELTVNPLPDIQLNGVSEEEILCILDSVNLVTTGAEQYKIFDAFYRLLGENTEVLAILPRTENRFTVIGQNEFGCTDSASIIVNAMVCCDVLLPTAFSPNGDGINDAFGPVTIGTPENYKFQIFNRWGELVFVSFKVEDKWNGYYKDGKAADMGTYFYIMTGNCYDGRPLQMKGDVTLIR